jgi:UDP-N-acetylglucosamine--N-acetylmuramyl-(pentapeptide) pyrophosphoryl-undecaprenol N-acetylglucosamine transferase
MAGHGAAIHLPQAELSAERLVALLQSLQRPALLAMAEKARGVARAAAAARVADVIERLSARGAA